MIQQKLGKSKARLSNPATANAVAHEIIDLEKGMVRGGEPSHLREMARRTRKWRRSTSCSSAGRRILRNMSCGILLWLKGLLPGAQ